MKRLIVALLLALSWSIVPLAQTPDEILKAVDNVRTPGKNFGFSLHVVHEDNGVLETEFNFRVRVKDAVKSLVTYESPSSSKGKRLLMVKQNMWVYLPSTRQSTRISPKQQLLGPMPNADLAYGIDYSDVAYSVDYSTESVADGVLDSQAVLNLRLVARSTTNPHQHIELVVAKNDFRPLQAKLFALSGSLLKTILYQDYQLVLGTQRPMRMEVLDAVNTSRRTIMHYSDFQLMQTPDLYFQKEYLPHIR